MVGVDSSVAAASPGAGAKRSRAADIAMLLACLAYAASLTLPWLRQYVHHDRREISAFGGAVVAGVAVRVPYLTAVPAIIGLALAGRRRRHRVELATATAAGSLVVVASLVLLLRSVAVPPESSSELTNTTPLLGFWCALATVLLTSASAVLRHRWISVVRGSAVTVAGPLALVAGFALFVSSLTVPWAIRRTTDFDGQPTVTVRLFVTDLPFGSLFLIVAIGLFALVAATVVTRLRSLRVASLSLAGAWLAVHLLALWVPNRITFRAAGHLDPRPGLYLGFAAIALVAVAAWQVTPPVKARPAPFRQPYLIWLIALAALAATAVAPWISIPRARAVNLNLTGTHIGLLDFPGDVTGGIVIGVLAVLLAITATGTTAVVTGSMRWFTVGLAMALLGLATAVILTPHKFLAYFNTDVSRTSLSIGAPLAVVAAVATIVAMMWQPARARSSLGSSNGSRARTLVGVTALAMTAVSMLVALFAGWVWVRQLDGDDAEFPGGILVSPIGAVFVIAGALLLAATTASLMSAGRSEWRVVTAAYAVACVLLLIASHRRADILGYGFPMRVTAEWHVGWTAALVAALSSIGTVIATSPSSGEIDTARDDDAVRRA